MPYNEIVLRLLDESIRTKEKVKQYLLPDICQATEVIIKALQNKKKILICGNGGSAADSQHFAAELVGRFIKERKALPAIALTVDTSLLTAWANDYEYNTIFSRQVEALGESGDILFAISTSGNSGNLLVALKTAREMGLTTISLLGKDGGKMKSISDYNITVPNNMTIHIQESHITIIHIICYLIEEALFPG